MRRAASSTRPRRCTRGAEAAEWEARLPLLRVVEVPDVNHYTIIFDQDAVNVVVAELRNPPAP